MFLVVTRDDSVGSHRFVDLRLTPDTHMWTQSDHPLHCLLATNLGGKARLVMGKSRSVFEVTHTPDGSNAPNHVFVRHLDRDVRQVWLRRGSVTETSLAF